MQKLIFFTVLVYWFLLKNKLVTGGTGTDSDKFTILHFGCWNKNCKEEASGLQKVVELSNQILNSPPETINKFIITGDNYYGESIKKFFSDGTEISKKDFEILKKDKMNKKKLEEKKTKIFKSEDLESGFNDCLNQIDFFPKDMILGNHDILDDPKHGDGERCDILSMQLQTLNTKGSINIHYPFAREIVDSKIAILYIDTNFYSIKEGDSLDYKRKINNCISNQDKTNKLDYETIIHKQNELIEETLSEYYLYYIFVAHAPLYGVKSKKDKNKIQCIPELLDLFDNEKNKNKKIIYLCADIHLFQHGIISNDNVNIHQVISGTGGTDLDNISIDTDYKISETRNLNYRILNQHKNHGISKLSLDENSITVSFYSIEENTGSYVYNHKIILNI